VLPGSLQEEDEGTVTQGRGPDYQDQQGRRVSRRGAAGLAHRSRYRAGPRSTARVHVHAAREIFDELRVREQSGVADYSGVTYEKSQSKLGVVLAVLQRGSRDGQAYERSTGTPRPLRTRQLQPVAKGNGPFYFPDGRARFNVADYRPPVDDASEEYPIYLTTGRVVSQFLSGTQTRRPWPARPPVRRTADRDAPQARGELGIADGDWATAETRRGTITLRAQVVTTIRPDTIFIPYHWPGRKSANQLTVAAQDPISKIPQYKVCGCRVRKADAAPEYAAVLEPQQ
jgi:assimilatory nitrate reductase catalytic subunit